MSRNPSNDSEIEQRPRRRRTQTIEATGKAWKFIQLIGFCGMASGIAAGAAHASGGVSIPPDTGIWLFLAAVGGFFVYLFGRAGAWWYHG